MRIRAWLGLAAAACLFLGPAAVVQANPVSTCAELCPGTGDCTINLPQSVTVIDVAPGSVLDCGTRNLTTQGNGRVSVTDGSFKLIAGNLTVASGTKITAEQGLDGIGGGFEIELSGALSVSGSLIASHTVGGGDIELSVDGVVTINSGTTPRINVDGAVANADGGSITISSESDVNFLGGLSADGGSGSGASQAGSITVETSGNILVDAIVTAFGRNNEGGYIEFTAEGNITVDPAGSNHTIQAEGGSSDGDGGEINLTADGSITLNSGLSVQSGIGSNGGEASGGRISIEAGCGGVSIDARLSAIGGEYDAGEIVVETPGGLTVSATSKLEAYANGHGGGGGNVTLRSDAGVVVVSGATIDVHGNDNGPGEEGIGGSLDVRGCTTDVGSISIDARGYDGGTLSFTGEKDVAGETVAPLRISDLAVLQVVGGAGDDGIIELLVSTATNGTCDVIGDECPAPGQNCVEGCQTYICVGPANPDTGDGSEFDVTPDIDEYSALSSSCSQGCQP